MTSPWFHLVKVGDRTFLDGVECPGQAADLLLEAKWEIGPGPPSQPWLRNPTWNRALSYEELELVAKTLPKLFPEEGDWTMKGGRSNSSDLFVELSDEVGRIIRDSAHALLAGNAQNVGRLIMAHLAHRHGLAPGGVK